MKKLKLLLIMLCGILYGTITLASCSGKEEEKEPESEEVPKDGDIRQETQVINLYDFTNLEVIQDCTRFTPVTQEQSYNPETDMNPGCTPASRNADAGSTFYMSSFEGGLFAFWKETASAGIPCDKPGCGHDMKTVKGDCQANLHVLDADVSGMQYYNNDLYYTLSDGGAAILYRTSLNREIKLQYAMLLGEKGYGACKSWLIHRGYIYFYVENDGIYRMSVDNPSDKEMIINMSEDGMSSGQLSAEGSYIYFRVRNDNAFAAARYNIESGQIEQFVDMEESLYDFFVHNGKIYYTGYLEENLEYVVYRYDIATGKNEVFLQEEDRENQTANFNLFHGDSDYIYIRKQAYGKKDYYDGGEMSSNISYLVYTWDGVKAGEILNMEGTDRDWEYEAFKVFHRESTQMAGSDSDRIYYISMQYDIQIQEDGVTQEIVEGTEKTVISYINKSEISAEAAASIHIAGEIYDSF